jgi:hypothetical protein
MANALAFTTAAAATTVAGVLGTGNSNGINSAAWTYANGAPGAADTIANAELLKGVSLRSRLYTFLSTNHGTTAQTEAAFAALGGHVGTHGGTLFRFIGGAVPTATMTTATATGSVRISLAHSMVA